MKTLAHYTLWFLPCLIGAFVINSVGESHSVSHVRFACFAWGCFWGVFYAYAIEKPVAAWFDNRA